MTRAPVATFWPWLAGFTDGEGYVDWHGTATLVLTTTHLPTLEWIQDQIGGSLRTLQRDRNAQVASSKPAYQLSWSGSAARGVLTSILPYLREKRRQAELVLSVTHAGKRLAEAEWRRRDSVRLNLKNLRHGRPEQWPAPDPASAGGVAGDGLP